MKLAKIIDLNIHGDERGSLISLEQHKNIPFTIKRVYYIFDTKQGVARGFHSHQSLEQVVICIKGCCRFVLDNGSVKEEITLNSASQGLYIGHNLWREMHDFTDDCILLVLASEFYDEADYIRDYPLFIKLVRDEIA